jgi:benzylsuccinate CoA-transferase BbsE subunit/naphthyl-2-methylsuccinate CoA transferase subunit
MEAMMDGSLSNVRVLDFTGELGPYAAKLYAGLGADVIHLEPVDGDPLRKVGPFYQNKPGMDRGFQYLYYNAGKRGMALDLRKSEGREIFCKLCASADLLLESFVPGYLEGLGMSYDRLSTVNPRLVQTSITPFGSFGPYKDMPGSDLTCSAMGGFLFLGGVDHDKPVRACDNQAYRMAEAYAAVGSSIALFFAKKTGIGQFVDVSCMEAAGMALENSAQFWDLEGAIRRGRGTEASSCTIHPCRDGYIIIVAIMGRNKVMWEPFANWMKEEQIEEWEVLFENKWIDPYYRRTREAYETFNRIFNRYTMKFDKMTLYEMGQAKRVALTPISNGKDLLENPQLRHRDYWKTLSHPNLAGEITYPGAPYELGELNWRLGNPAPSLGQHTAEILRELGYTDASIQALAKEGIVYVG